TLNLVQQPLADLLVADEVYLEANRSQVNGLQFGNDIPKLGPSHLDLGSDVEFRVEICLAEAHVGQGKMHLVVPAGPDRVGLRLEVSNRTVGEYQVARLPLPEGEAFLPGCYVTIVTVPLLGESVPLKRFVTG